MVWSYASELNWLVCDLQFLENEDIKVKHQRVAQRCLKNGKVENRKCHIFVMRKPFFYTQMYGNFSTRSTVKRVK